MTARLQAELGAIGEALFIACDVGDADEVEQAVQRTVDHFGSLDIVFANAGINGVWAPVEELQPDEWDRTMQTNLWGTFLTVHFAVPHLRHSDGPEHHRHQQRQWHPDLARRLTRAEATPAR